MLQYASSFWQKICLIILKGNNIQPEPCTQAGVCGAHDRRTADGGDPQSRTCATRSADSGDCVFQRCCSSEGVDGGGPGGGGGGADGGGTRADRGHDGGAADGGAADGGGPGGGGGRGGGG